MVELKKGDASPSAVSYMEDPAEKFVEPVIKRNSITAWANAVWDNSHPRAYRGRAEEGVYVFSDEQARVRRRNGGEVFTAPDGYVRKSPAQEMVVPPGYAWRQVRKLALPACGIVFAGLAAYLLFRLQITGF